MNSETKPEIKQHEYELLNEIAQDSLVTQSNLSEQLGIAVGSVNWYIKRLISRGWIKVSRLDRTRLKYDLTSEGMKIFSQRALMYARDSLKVSKSLRDKASALVTDLKQRGLESIYLYGNDEIMDILRLTCIEHQIEIAASPNGTMIKADGQGFKVIHDKKFDKKSR